MLLEIEFHELPYESYGVNSHSPVDDVIVCSAEHTVCKGKTESGWNESTPIFHGPERGCPLDAGSFAHPVVHGVSSDVRLGPGRALGPLDELAGNNRVRDVGPVPPCGDN